MDLNLDFFFTGYRCFFKLGHFWKALAQTSADYEEETIRTLALTALFYCANIDAIVRAAHW